jgi:hypothetical protein
VAKSWFSVLPVAFREKPVTIVWLRGPPPQPWQSYSDDSTPPEGGWDRRTAVARAGGRPGSVLGSVVTPTSISPTIVGSWRLRSSGDHRVAITIQRQRVEGPNALVSPPGTIVEAALPDQISVSGIIFCRVKIVWTATRLRRGRAENRITIAIQRNSGGADPQPPS